MFVKRNFFLISLFIVVLLSLIQYKTSKPTDFLHLTEIERIEQLRRMNEYPPAAFRMANWLEARKESVIYFKLEKNFIGIFDLTNYFGRSFMPLLFPFFLYGYFEGLKTRKKEILLLSAIPIIFTTLVGHASFYGPIGIYPIIYSSILYGVYKFLIIFIVHEKQIN